MEENQTPQTATEAPKEKTTERMRRFVLAFIARDMENATAAYMEANPTCKSSHAARVAASRLLAQPRIQALLKDEMARVLKQARFPVEKRVLDFWVKRAFADRTQIVGLDGSLKLSEAELRDRGLDVLIDGLIPHKTQSGSWTEVRFANRDEAAEKLAQYCQLIKPQDQRVLLEDLRIGAPPRPEALPDREAANRAAIAAASGAEP